MKNNIFVISTIFLGIVVCIQQAENDKLRNADRSNTKIQVNMNK